MAIQRSDGILRTDAAGAGFTPTNVNASLARQNSTFKFWFWDNTQWVPQNMNISGAWINYHIENGVINAGSVNELALILNDLANKISEGFAVGDGNLYVVIRQTAPGALEANLVDPPTSDEKEAPHEENDTVLIYHQNSDGDNWGVYSRWLWNGTDWAKVIDLYYADYVSEVKVQRDTLKNELTPETNSGGVLVLGTTTELLLANAGSDGNAGLMSAAQSDKVNDMYFFEGLYDTSSILLGLSSTSGGDAIDNFIKATFRIVGSGGNAGVPGNNAFNLVQKTHGVTVDSFALTTYLTHAAAAADGNLSANDYYCLRTDNHEGVASNGKGPIFRKGS